MRTKFNFAVYCLGLVLALTQSDTNAQTARPVDDENFVGTWRSVSTLMGSGESLINGGSYSKLEIVRSGDGFRTRLISSSRTGKDVTSTVRESVFRLNSLGVLERKETAAQTWEPSEFPKTIEEKIELSKKGKLLLTTVLSGGGNYAV